MVPATRQWQGLRLHSSWALPALRRAPEQPGLCVVLCSAVEENFALYLDGSGEEGSRVSAGPLRSWPYFSPVWIFFGFKRKEVHARACCSLSVSTRRGLCGAGRLRACSNRHRLHFNTRNELGTVSEREHVEQPRSPGAEVCVWLCGAEHQAPSAWRG